MDEKKSLFDLLIYFVTSNVKSLSTINCRFLRSVILPAVASYGLLTSVSLKCVLLSHMVWVLHPQLSCFPR